MRIHAGVWRLRRVTQFVCLASPRGLRAHSHVPWAMNPFSLTSLPVLAPRSLITQPSLRHTHANKCAAVGVSAWLPGCPIGVLVGINS